jgi:hypothetical protein
VPARGPRPEPPGRLTHLTVCDGLGDGQDGPETAWDDHLTGAEYGRQPA